MTTKRSFTVGQLEAIGRIIMEALAAQGIQTLNWNHESTSGMARLLNESLSPRTFLAEELRYHLGDWMSHKILPDPKEVAVDPKGKFAGLSVTPAQMVAVLTVVIRALREDGVEHCYREDVNGLRAFIERFLEYQGYDVKWPVPQNNTASCTFYFQEMERAGVLSPRPLS